MASIRRPAAVGVALALLSAPSHAADRQSTTTVGLRSGWAGATGESDHDLLLGERLRWEVTRDGAPIAVRALADGRFALDPDGEPTLETSRVRSLGVELAEGGWTLGIGRQPVQWGGPRLVDGAQVVFHPGTDWNIGGWAGLAPDLYTTRPTTRFGGGPIAAWSRYTHEISMAGELLWDEGGLDRAGLLTQARLSADPTAQATGRLDLQLTDPSGTFGLADGAVSGRWQPTSQLRFDALYNAYSSLRYLRTEHLDPDLKRFDARAESLGVVEGIDAETIDTTVHHLVGAATQWQRHPPTELGPRLRLDGRYRYHPDVENRYARVTPSVAVLGIAEARVQVQLDGNALWTGESGLFGDVGLTTQVEPTSDRMFAVDGSVRMLINPTAYDGGVGWYADLFVDWVSPFDLVVIAGVDVITEPDPAYNDFDDVGVGAFLQLSYRLRPPTRPPRPAAHSASGY